MAGSCVLAGSAALHIGCGKVIIGLNQKKINIHLLEHTPELIIQTAKNLMCNTQITTWIIGCGLGTSPMGIKLIKTILKNIQVGSNVLIDADGLNILSIFPQIPVLTEKCVITPHPKEAARLLKCSIEDIEKNREKNAIKLAKKFNCWVVLKGHNTIIASKHGDIKINDTGNVGLATSGTGDVLSGIIGSLIAQKIPIQEAIIGGVWLHGTASDFLVFYGLGPIGLMAHELIHQVRKIRNAIIRT